MTKRLYYDNPYQREFTARVVARSGDGRRIQLDQTACYPTSGGQPHDLGTVNGAALVEVVDEGDVIEHVLATPVEGDEVRVSIDWERRFDHMQQHTGQHLLSAVLEERYGIATVSFHLGAESSTIDLATPELSDEVTREVERRCQEVIYENRPVAIAYEDAASAHGLRKGSAREGTLRIISIEGLDRSACGGTHVRATGEIGVVLLRRRDKMRGNVRLEFLCGGRAVRRARADYEALTRVARAFSVALDDAPAMVEAQVAQVQELAKREQKLAAELASLQAREEYENTPPGLNGIRRAWKESDAPALTDSMRTQAQTFAAQPRAVWVMICRGGPAVLVATSEDSGYHAGNVLKAALQAAGGRGGGSARVAQGSVPAAGLGAVELALRRELGFDGQA